MKAFSIFWESFFVFLTCELRLFSWEIKKFITELSSGEEFLTLKYENYDDGSYHDVYLHVNRLENGQYELVRDGDQFLFDSCHGKNCSSCSLQPGPRPGGNHCECDLAGGGSGGSWCNHNSGEMQVYSKDLNSQTYILPSELEVR